MTLREEYGRNRDTYEGKYGHSSWQWEDEGVPNTVLDYLSHMGEFTEDDEKFAREMGFWDVCVWCLEREAEEENRVKELDIIDRMNECGYALYDVTDNKIIFRDNDNANPLFESLIQFKNWADVSDYCDSLPKVG